MKCEEHVVWSNRDSYEKAREWYEAEYPDYTDEQRMEIFWEDNERHLEDERENLKHIAFEQPILAMATYHTWRGKAYDNWYVENNEVAECLHPERNCESSIWYVDELGDLRYTGSYHDGRVNVLYRVYKPGVSREQRRRFEYKLSFGSVTRKDITRLTERIGDKIAAVYDWEVRKGRKAG